MRVNWTISRGDPLHEPISICGLDLPCCPHGRPCQGLPDAACAALPPGVLPLLDRRQALSSSRRQDPLKIRGISQLDSPLETVLLGCVGRPQWPGRRTDLDRRTCATEVHLTYGHCPAGEQRAMPIVSTLCLLR